MTDYDPDFDDEEYLEPPIALSQYHSADSELILQQLKDLVETAPTLPLSSTPRLSREEILDLVDEALVRLPDELKSARWLLKERDEFLERMRHEGDEIIAQARDRAERMVQRTEVVKASEQRAYQILDTAEAEARRLRHEVEDFCDQKLASFEIVLQRTLKLVGSGRAKLQGTNLPVDEAPDAAFEAYEAAHAAPSVLPPAGADEDDDDFGHLPPPPGDGDLFDQEEG